jgi:hypothetical protein
LLTPVIIQLLVVATNTFALLRGSEEKAPPGRKKSARQLLSVAQEAPVFIPGPIAPAVKRFHQRFLAETQGVGVWAGLALPILLHGLLLAVKRHSLQTLGEATMLHWLCAGSVCRWLGRLRFPVDGWYEHAFQRFLKLAARLADKRDQVLVSRVEAGRRHGRRLCASRCVGRPPRRMSGGLANG